jgi:hypothetical protein
MIGTSSFQFPHFYDWNFSDSVIFLFFSFYLYISDDIINILPFIKGVMVDYHTQKTNNIRDEVEGDIVVF